MSGANGDSNGAGQRFRRAGYDRSVEAVLTLHSERRFTSEYLAPETYSVCVECRQAWPCATVQAIRSGADVV